MKQHALRSRTRASTLSSSEASVAPVAPVAPTQTPTLEVSTIPSLMTGVSPLVTPSKTPKFLRALYLMLETEDPNVLRWSSNGQYFQVFHVEELENDILPKYFNHGNFASFQRQLNNFGFRKWTKRRSSVCTFSHDTFTQQNPPPQPSADAFFTFDIHNGPFLSSVVPMTTGSHKRKRPGLVETEEEEKDEPVQKKICVSPTTADGLVMMHAEEDPFVFDPEEEHEEMFHELSPFEWDVVLTTLTNEEEEDLLVNEKEFEPFDYLQEEEQESSEEELKQAATLFLMEEEIPDEYVFLPSNTTMFLPTVMVL